MLTWGTKVVGGDAIALSCPNCNTQKSRLFFLYKYFGLFWMGIAHSRKWIVQCNECNAEYEPDHAYVQATPRPVSWNYRWGWAVWIAIWIGAYATGL